MKLRLPALFPWLLIVTSVLLSAWLIVSRRTAGLARPQMDRMQRFAGFFPRIPGWQVRVLHVAASEIEPNILAFALHAQPEDGPPPRQPDAVVARLVHGYNMVDCMRIKGYRVEHLAKAGSPRTGQVWRMTDPGGRTAIWLTLMVESDTLSAPGVDTRSMAFPRVGTPDAPGWNPTGITWSGMRHPLRNTRLWLRSRWNSSRRDILTFLRLKPHAWVSDRYFALVIEGWKGTPDTTPQGTDLETLQALLQALHLALRNHDLNIATGTGRSAVPAQ